LHDIRGKFSDFQDFVGAVKKRHYPDRFIAPNDLRNDNIGDGMPNIRPGHGSESDEIRATPWDYNRPKIQRVGLDPAIRQQASLAHEIKGSAHVHVDFKNMPRGVKTSAKSDGVFQTVSLRRGKAAPVAEG
jgi:hypothetical protein